MKLHVVALAVVAGIAGCGQIPYRTQGLTADQKCHDLYNRVDDVSNDNKSISQEERNHPCWARAVEERDQYDMMFVEFDDQGWISDSARLPRPSKDDFLDRFFEKLGQIYNDNRENGLSLVVFVHGWHHNASAKDHNVRDFRRFTRDLAVAERIMNAGKTRKPPRVVGIYIGWRGESLELPDWMKNWITDGVMTWITWITFWERKTTASRVAQGSVRELFARLDFLRDRARDKLRFHEIRENVKKDAGDRNVRMLTIAHSFGGLITFEALGGDFVRSAARSSDEKHVSRFGDLVIFVNPAFEGARFEALMATGQRIPQLKHNQLPVIVVATTTADLATRWLFPFARGANIYFERTEGAQYDAIVQAVGHNPRFRTHWLKTCEKTDTGCDNVCPGLAPVPPKDPDTYPGQIRGEYTLMSRLGHDGLKTSGPQFLCNNLKLTRTRNWSPDHNPFWVVTTDGSVMKGHNDIFNPQFRSFVRQMYFGILAERLGQPHPD